MVMTERDIRDILRGRPITVPQVFVERDRIHLLCPPVTNVATFESAKIAFGPFTASVLAGMALVSIPARLEEAQDLWSLIMRDAMPGEEQRRPGGEPLRTIRTATLGWRLLALLGASIEALVGAATAVSQWRAAGQPRGYQCPLGSNLLSFQTQGAEATTRQLESFGTPVAASDLFGFPSELILSRHVGEADAAVISARCQRSAAMAADVFSVAASVAADPFWRTFMKWKHGAIGTSPSASPLWLKNEPDLQQAAVDARLNGGIVVFDGQAGPKVYVWPAERVDLVGYSRILVGVQDLTDAIVASVLKYVLPRDGWPIAVFDFEPGAAPTAAEQTALDHLAASAYRVAALAGMWREPSLPTEPNDPG
jgi:hypothetical protein